MPIDTWRAFGYFIVAIIAVAIFTAFMRNRSDTERDSSLAATKGEVIVTITLIGIGILLRISFLTEFQGGKLTSDENMMSIIYTSGIVHGETVRFGAEKLVYSLLLDAWLHLSGFSVTAIRSLSTVASILGIGFWFLSLRLLCGQRIALWASAFLSISVFGIYFGRLSMEMFWVLFFVPLCLLIYAYWKRHPSLMIAASGGAVAAFGLFTYPGFLLALVATLGGLAATWLWVFIKPLSDRVALKPNRETVSGAAAAFTAFLLVATIGLALHWKVFAAPGEAIFAGGGSLSLSLESVLAAIQQMLVDLFIECSSWYLYFSKKPFVEVVLLPFFITGIMVSWNRTRDWKIRGIILSMPAVILLSAVTGAYPGMRRAIYFLLPFYYFSAVGIVQFFEILQDWHNRTAAASKIVTPLSGAIALVAVALAHPIYYQLTYGRDAVSRNHGEGFAVKKIPLEFISSILLSNDVILSKQEFDKHQFDHLIYEHHPRMEKRYGILQEDARGVHFLEDIDDPAIKTLRNRDDWRLLTWTSREIARLSNQVAICVDDKHFVEDHDLPFVAFRDSLRSDQEKSHCFADGKLGDLDSKFLMGYRHMKERFVHQLDCAGPYCDKNRPESIYTLGGAVTFLLAQEPGGCAPRCQLVLQIEKPRANRKSRILISNEQIGLLSIEGLDEENSARFTIPDKAFSEDGIVEVTITPEPGDFLGWDIRSAEIVRTGL